MTKQKLDQFVRLTIAISIVAVFFATIFLRPSHAQDTEMPQRFAVLGVISQGNIYVCDTHEQVVKVLTTLQAAEDKSAVLRTRFEGCGMVPAIFVAVKPHDTYGVNFDDGYLDLRVLEVMLLGIRTPQGPRPLSGPRKQFTWSAFPIVTKEEFKKIQANANAKSA